MAGGFEAVPEGLRSSARSITAALGNAAGIAWCPPSGDYGHTGVRSAFAAFVADGERRVAALEHTAAGLARGLADSAGAYEDSEAAAVRTLLAAAERRGESILAQAGPGSAPSPQGRAQGLEAGTQPAPGRASSAGGPVEPPPAGEPSELFKRLNPGRTEGR
jgi:hypothetical protein